MHIRFDAEKKCVYVLPESSARVIHFGAAVLYVCLPGRVIPKLLLRFT